MTQTFSTQTKNGQISRRTHYILAFAAAAACGLLTLNMTGVLQKSTKRHAAAPAPLATPAPQE